MHTQQYRTNQIIDYHDVSKACFFLCECGGGGGARPGRAERGGQASKQVGMGGSQLGEAWRGRVGQGWAGQCCVAGQGGVGWASGAQLGRSVRGTGLGWAGLGGDSLKWFRNFFVFTRTRERAWANVVLPRSHTTCPCELLHDANQGSAKELFSQDLAPGQNPGEV